MDTRFAIERPHAPADLLNRQGSYRGFDKLVASGSSPFKRHLSLPLGAQRPDVLTSHRTDKPSKLIFVVVVVVVFLAKDKRVNVVLAILLTRSTLQSRKWQIIGIELMIPDHTLLMSVNS